MLVWSSASRYHDYYCIHQRPPSVVRPAGVSVSTCAHDAIWINATPHPLHNHCKHIIYYFEQEALIYITIIVLNQAFSYLLFPLFCLLLLLDLLYTPSGSNAILYRAKHILLSTYAHCSQIYESASTSLNVVPMKSSSIGIIIRAWGMGKVDKLLGRSGCTW